MDIVRNGWYVAALAANIDSGAVAIGITGIPMLLYRIGEGAIVAMEDRCAHRHVPLSMGVRVGDDIRCPYHGFRYAPSGRCIEIPGQDHIPEAVRVRAFPVVELYGLVWIWPGVADSADPALIPDYPWLEAEGYVQDWIEFEIAAPILAVVENLMDLTHVPFAHRLLGVGNPVHEATMRTEADGNRISCIRDLARPDGTVLRYEGHYLLPGVVNASVTPYDSATGLRCAGFSSNSLHCLTPIDENRTRYIALKSWNERTSAAEIEAMRELNRVTLEEDRVILEAMMKNKATADDLPAERLIDADRAAVIARRRYAAALASERS